MSVQNLQDIISDLELHNQSLVSQNEDLRYRLSFFSGDQPGSAANLQKLLLDNDSLRKQMDELDLSFQDERRALYDREKAVMRILEQFQIPEEVVEGVRFELEDEREVMKEQVARVEDEVRARDRIIDQLEITLENLRKEYQESCDILTYDMNQKIEDMDIRLRQADHIINQQAAQISKLTSQSQSSLEIEDLYTALIAKYNDQIHLNEELNDKLTATEFDLYATVEKLDLLQISDTVDETAKTKAFMSVAVGTDPDYMDSPILSKDLKRLSDKFESSQYQVSELSIENSALECRVEELEQELSFYKDRTCTNLHSPNPLSESEKLTVLTETNRRLQSQIEAYEDEIFELSEQISLAEADTGPGEKVKVITRRLSTMMEQGPFGKRTPESGRKKV
ncbi:hypothetical protein ACHWQZ_G011275 [Mnemiopsis leidyi]